MARILYLVSGEGNGHASRSAAVIEELRARGHEVAAVSDSQALEVLERIADKTVEAVTPHMAYRHNAVRACSTLWMNAARFLRFVMDFRNVKAFLKSWKPTAIVTDFNPMASWIWGMPIVSIDNQGMLSQGKIEIPRGCWWEYVKSRIVVGAFVPRATVRVVTMFADVPVRLDAVRVGPIVSRKIRSAKPSRGRHLLVYQTSPTHDRLADLLPSLDVEVRAYGFGRIGRVGKVRFMPFDVKKWHQDLASCRAVIMNGGFSLMTEALILGKPVLCFPIVHQFEQILNAYYLEKEGLGMWGKEVSRETIMEFLNQEAVLRARIKRRKWENGAAQAADVIEQVLTAKRR